MYVALLRCHVARSADDPGSWILPGPGIAQASWVKSSPPWLSTAHSSLLCVVRTSTNGKFLRIVL